jgi:hypothetical protein
MTPKLVDYIGAGKSLAAEERLEAAHQLLLSVDRDVDHDQSTIDAAWDEVVARRVQEIVSNSGKLVDGRDVHARVRAAVSARRQ